MSTNTYHLVTNWRIPGRIEEVFEVLGDATALPRWWPAVYLDVRELAPGDENGVGKTISLYTKGWLPYTIHWQFQVTSVNRPFGSELEAWGDLNGRGIWTFSQADGDVAVKYDWLVDADRRLFQLLSPLFKPILVANHYWAMNKGEISLGYELARRRGADAPAPPGPTFAAFARGQAWPDVRRP